MASPVLLALLTALTSAGLTGLFLRQNAAAASTDILNPDGRVIASVPDNLTLSQIEQNTREKTYKVVKGYIKRTSTTATVRPTAANQKITVTGFKVLNLSMLFDTNFKLSGKFDLVINNSTFLSVDAGDLTDTDNFSLDLFTNGWEIPDFQTIELYAWTSNGVACAVTLSVTVGV